MKDGTVLDLLINMLAGIGLAAIGLVITFIQGGIVLG